MKLALFGATGLSGAVVLREALARGHRVTVLARKRSAVPAHDALAVVEGNALVAADVDATLAGCEAVIHCVGVGGKGDGKPTTLCSQSIELLLPLMGKHGIKRLVVMSNYGAGSSGPWLVRKLAIPLFLRWLAPIIDDKNRMEAILARSDVEWIAPRFPAIVDGDARPVKAGIDRRVGFKITTGSVAAFMLDQLTDATYVRSAPAASN